MQRIARGAAQPAAIHAVVVLQVPDDRLHRLPAFEPFALLIAQALELAPVDDLGARVGRVHAPKAQIPRVRHSKPFLRAAWNVEVI
jgi:hypothetical protein